MVPVYLFTGQFGLDKHWLHKPAVLLELCGWDLGLLGPTLHFVAQFCLHQPCLSGLSLLPLGAAKFLIFILRFSWGAPPFAGPKPLTLQSQIGRAS